MSNYPKIVDEIHGEFNAAGDKILAEARTILAMVPEQQKQKAERLDKIGFTATKEVRQLQEIRLSDEQANLVEYYQRKYPLYKFITDDQVKTICQKYGLINAPVSHYKGFVPDVKLRQIESAVISSEDSRKDQIRITRCWGMPYWYDMLAFLMPRHLFTGNWLHSSMREKFLDADDSRIYYMRVQTPYSVKVKDSTVYVEGFRRIDNQALTICAPKKDFDMRGLKGFGYNFFSSTETLVPDPVVLKKVKGGNLILAAWGDEASDTIVVNQNLQ